MQQNEQGRVVKIAGPLVLAKGLRRANLFDVVRVSDRGLIGEIIEMRVVSSCALALEGFSNCCKITAPGIRSRSSFALAIEPAMPAMPSVSTISAPRAFSRLRRSILIVSGMVSIR